MYMTFRNMQVIDTARMADAIGMLKYIVDKLNSDHGGTFAASMNVGGDPTKLAIASPWASLGDYENARASIAGDEELQSAIRLASGMVSGTTDAIAKIHVPPGDRSAYASVNTAMMRLPSITDAVGLALEIADHVTSNHGVKVGVLTAITGPRAGLMWLSQADSMAALGELGEALTADATYMEFFKRSDGLFADGSLEASIWQML